LEFDDKLLITEGDLSLLSGVAVDGNELKNIKINAHVIFITINLYLFLYGMSRSPTRLFLIRSDFYNIIFCGLIICTSKNWMS